MAIKATLIAAVALAACAQTTPPPLAAQSPAAATTAAPAAFAPPPVKPTERLVAPMAKLAFMRGVWRGPATGTSPDGHAYHVTQTERMGPMLGGDVVVIEGRGYADDGSSPFNAFAVAGYNVQTQKYELRSYAQGYAGTFELQLTADGYIWEIPAGPNAVMRFTATIKGDTWREVGEYTATGQPPVHSFEMNLTKIGDTDWPLGTPISPK